MRRILIFTLSTLAFAVPFIYGQRFEARNTVPDTVSACYLNNTAYYRYTRQPMHIDNLIAIIRKIEKKTWGQWDARRIARTLVNRYMFDGMEFHWNAKPEFQYRQKPEERAKSLMVKELIPVSAEEQFPDYILDNDEKCALHWMLSHSLNATMRDDEERGTNYPGSGYNPGYNGNGYNSNGNGYNPTNNAGSNPFNSNPTYNNNNNNGNSNGNPSLGNNYYNRGKRDVAESDETPDNEDNYGQSESESDEAGKDYEGAPKSRSSVKAADMLEELPQDEPDFDLLPNASGASDSKSGKQIAQTNSKKTKKPLETGVIYTPYGAVAGGRLIAGIAAGLEPAQMGMNGVVSGGSSYAGGSNPWSSGSGLGYGNSNNGYNGYNNQPSKSTNLNNNGQPQNQYPQNQYPGQQPQPQYPGQAQTGGQRYQGRRKKRQAQNLQPLESLYAATLAGDAGQAAILNAVNQISNSPLPSGVFNDSVCPREYVLNDHPNQEFYRDSTSWTYMTEAEVRGGVDGLILGANIRRWDPSFNLRLSEILEQYYSDYGIAGDPNFRSCDRSALLGQSVDGNKLRDQTRAFAYLYNNRTNGISDQNIVADPNAFERLVEEAYQRMYGSASSLSNIGPGCTRRLPSGSDNNNDNAKYIVPKLTVYGVIDHSANEYEIDEQRRFLGQLAYELDVSPVGSRLGVIDGNSGSVIISPNWTDTSSILACRVMSLNSQTKAQEYSRVLTSLRSELARVKSEELRYNYTTSNGIVILFMVQGRKIEQDQRTELKRIIEEINEDREIGSDVSVVFASSKYPDSDFEDLRFVRIQANQNISQSADEFAQSLLRNTHGALGYLQCNTNNYNQDLEHTIPTTMYLSPGTISYYKISPTQFFSSRALVLRFTSENGKARVCMSRKEWYPNQSNEGNSGVECKETTGVYIPAGRNDVDVEFRSGLTKPCNKYRSLGCDPIYISITPSETTRPGEVGLDCSLEPCQASNQVKVTFTHWGMRCSGAIQTLSTVAILTTLIALLNWMKTT